MISGRALAGAIALVAILVLAACRAREPQAPVANADDAMTCPVLKAKVAWDLTVRYGPDFLVCGYRFAATNEPIASIYVGNHPDTPTLKFVGFHPDGSGSAWFADANAGREWPRSYWSFRENPSRAMATTVIRIEANSYEDLKKKARVAQAFER
ncbi:hypothetical protein MMG85_01890 [Pseudoxanthomonas sp. LH2527]|uniref:hypothetical protein n=1 Tax=Pseudoxanthomonas sp. LH2527 TaxID=2923249 RepID=UPI001F13E938|nr:hypothetical protein [Pseudoxanthomonas sp. LH2527]MCH6482322.1 hypothetical protein [Pseudoxanthomonas sp. LH2527]